MSSKNKKTAVKAKAAPKKLAKPPKTAPSKTPAKKQVAKKTLKSEVKPLRKGVEKPSTKSSKVDSKLAPKAADRKSSARKSAPASKTIATKAPAKVTAPSRKRPANHGALEKKDALKQAVAKSKELRARAQEKVPAKKHKTPPPPPKSNTKPEIVAKIRQAQAEKEKRKDLAQVPPKSSLVPLTQVPPHEKGKDRLILMVRDPYWLHAHWDVTRQTVDRAKVSLAENWHTVKPILRLLKLDDSGTTSNSETVFRDIEIHGGVRNWYIDVEEPPCRFRVLMGYLCANERFYELARSNVVMTPVPGGKEAADDHWADIAKDPEHVYSMSGGYSEETQTGDLTEVFEERLKRTMDADVLSQFGSGAEGSLKRHKHFHFDVDAELIVFGSTHPEAHLTIGTDPIKVRSDGSFSLRMPLPDRRQVLPVTAKSRDGVDEQTVVIAVERNTKVMEPLSLDSEDV